MSTSSTPTITPRTTGRGMAVCNRVDCTKSLKHGRSYCPLTNAYYCPDCAARINQICGPGTCKPVIYPRAEVRQPA